MKKTIRKFEPIDFPPPSALDIENAEYLKNMPNSEIDFSEIPDLSQKNVRHYYKKTNLVAIDEDVLNIFKQKGSDYIKRINSVLRSAAVCL